MNQTVFWCFAILGLFLWWLLRPQATAPWKILGAFALLLAVQPLNLAVLQASARAYPLKYDCILQALDQSLGLTAFQIARIFSSAQRSFLLGIYEFLSDAMIVWYGIHLVIRGGEARKLLYAYLITFAVGGCLYGIVPAMGPRYAFGDQFPVGTPHFVAIPALLEGYPNAMPSLHLATALLFVLFNGRNRWLLLAALLFLAGTAAATLTFEHYVIDLVVAVPFACFAASLARRKIIPALTYLGVVLAWLGMIRLASPVLVQHPYALRAAALLTLAVGIRAIVGLLKETETRSSLSYIPASSPLPVNNPLPSPQPCRLEGLSGKPR